MSSSGLCQVAQESGSFQHEPVGGDLGWSARWLLPFSGFLLGSHLGGKDHGHCVDSLGDFGCGAPRGHTGDTVPTYNVLSDNLR